VSIVDGIAVHYRELGRGTPGLILHGAAPPRRETRTAVRGPDIVGVQLSFAWPSKTPLRDTAGLQPDHPDVHGGQVDAMTLRDSSRGVRGKGRSRCGAAGSAHRRTTKHSRIRITV
jgi:hypothetical protein